MKAVSSRNIHFPSLNFGMAAGVPIELPGDKKSQEAILSSRHVKKLAEAKAAAK
jgi:hypothetical protein